MATAAPTTTITTPDGRSLDVYLAGPLDGDVLLFHLGTPSAALPYPPAVDIMAERGLRYVAFNRAGYGSSTRRPGRSVADVVDDARTVLDHLEPSLPDDRLVRRRATRARLRGLLADRIRAVATIASVAPYPADGLDYLDGMGDENIEEFECRTRSRGGVDRIQGAEHPAVAGRDRRRDGRGVRDLIDDVDRGALTGDFADWVAASFREALRESYWGWFDDDMAFIEPWGFELDAIRVPVHVWQGRHDRMVPYAHGEWLAAHIPTAIPHLFDDTDTSRSRSTRWAGSSTSWSRLGT